MIYHLGYKQIFWTQIYHRPKSEHTVHWGQVNGNVLQFSLYYNMMPIWIWNCSKAISFCIKMAAPHALSLSENLEWNKVGNTLLTIC